jgi:phosphate transport system permease protein
MTMNQSLASTSLSADQRRELVQATAKKNFRKRVIMSRAFVMMLFGAVAIAFVPLFSIVFTIVHRGWHYISWAFLTTPQHYPAPFNKSVGGISNAITGSLVVDGVALVMAIPLSMALAIVLYEGRGRFVTAFRRLIEVMVGLPSILFGLFVYVFIVTPLGYDYSGLAGSVALTLLMMPVMTVASEAALRDVPPTLSEAALALGARRSRVMFRVLIPYALPRMFTGILLSLSRAVGETAPVLLIINASMVTNWNPLGTQTTMPLLIFNNQLASNPVLIASSWAIALVLIVAVFSLNFTSRLIVARSRKG